MKPGRTQTSEGSEDRGPITVTREAAADLTVFTVTGRLDSNSISRCLDAFYSGELSRHTLWDFTGAPKSALTSEDLARLAEMLGSRAARRAGGKTALVFSRDYSFGMGRMFGTYAEIENLSVEFRSFRDLGEARRWLGS